MCYMTYKVTREYFEYKKTVERTNVILTSMEFPAVTICSPVTLPKSRVEAAGVEQIIQLEKFLGGVQRYGFSKARRILCDLNTTCTWSWFEDECICLSNPCQSEYCEKGHPECRCSVLLCDQFPGSCFLTLLNTTDENDDTCICQNRELQFNKNFTVFYTPSHGKCYSFNYAGELSKQRMPLETKKYGGNNGLQLYLQIRDDEVINLLTKEIGVIVVVHDPREYPYVSEYGLIVRAGDSASLRVQKQQINRLGPPWGQCLNSGSHLPFIYNDTPYSQLGCQRHCQNFYIHEKCRCFKRSLLPSLVKRPKIRNRHLCNFTEPSQKKCADDVMELIENETIPCNCHQACRENVFQTSLTAGHLNKNFFRIVKAVKTLRKENGRYIASFTSKKNNILGLKVYYGTLSLQNSTEMPAYSWETLIANIGGNLGFFMGLTLITFLELAELLWDLLKFIVQSK